MKAKKRKKNYSFKSKSLAEKAAFSQELQSIIEQGIANHKQGHLDQTFTLYQQALPSTKTAPTRIIF